MSENSIDSKKFYGLMEQNNDLLKKVLILELHKLEIPHQKIREIVGGDMSYISKLLKPLKKRK